MLSTKYTPNKPQEQKIIKKVLRTNTKNEFTGLQVGPR